jgi:hypothetical protein
MSFKLAVTIDVEEEGLFCGQYESQNLSVRNVPELARLDALFEKWEIKPTLLVGYAAAADPDATKFLRKWSKKHHAEVGAHLHYWNTPPLEKLSLPDPVPSDLIPAELLYQKLNTLMDTLKRAGFDPLSFRMGRFNMGPNMFLILEATGIRIDSSVAPLRCSSGGPDHLCCPMDPYFPNPCDILQEGDSHILEVPVTIVPITSGMMNVIHFMNNRPWLRNSAVWLAENLFSLPAQPMGTGSLRLNSAVDLHLGRGGKVVTTFFHSSELMPGGCPQHRTDRDVDRFIKKLDRFFEHMHEKGAESLTLSELAEEYGQPQRPKSPVAGECR